MLGGGGPLGIAWEAAMLEGWAERWAQEQPSLAGWPPLKPLLAGRIIGTSAGAIVGAHLAAHGSVTAMVADQQEPLGPDAPPKPAMIRFMAALLKAKLLSRGLTGMRRSMGKSARRAALAGEPEFVAAIARSYAPQGPWPRG